MIETEAEIHSQHIIPDHEFVHHIVGEVCPCQPEHITAPHGDNVYLHQRLVRNGFDKPAKYRTYLLFTDNTYDLKVEDK